MIRRKRGRNPIGTPPVETDLPELYDLWNQALDTAPGIAIPTATPALLAAKLYAARRECGHTAYHHLKIVQLENEVWIKPR